MSLLSRLAACLFLLLSMQVHSATLPAVTGLTLEGDQFSWDAQEGATGYNIYFSYGYYDTVSQGTSFTVTEPGKYTVVSFNDQGEFGVFAPPQGSSATTFVVYDGTTPESVDYQLYGNMLYVYNTCEDVGPGETCTARCPREYTSYYGTSLTLNGSTGGACSTSDIIEADAFILPKAYRCTVPTFSGEVVAQVACSYR